jgi:hypothetical protein
MMRTARIALKSFLSAALGLWSLPMLLYGGYLLICWFRIHTSSVYYVDYLYALAALIFLVLGTCSMVLTLYVTCRQPGLWLLLVVPVFLGFATLVFIPNHRPVVDERLLDDGNYMEDIRVSLGDWKDAHHRFAADESEFKQAMAEGAMRWHVPGDPIHESQYRQRRKSLPYQIVVIPRSTGPRLTQVSERPGVIYYCVSQDLQEFWVTMTVLDSEVAPSAMLRRRDGDVDVLHVEDRELSVKQLTR